MRVPAIESMDHIVLHATAGAQASPDDYVRVPDASGRRTEDELVQFAGPFRPSQRLVLFNDHYLESGHDGQRRVLNLAYIAPDALKVREISWRWLIAGLVASVGATASATAGAGIHALVLGILALSCLVCCAMTSRSREIFRTRTGGIAVVEISHWLWGRRTSRAFAAQLVERMRAAERELPGDTQRLAAEMAEHRRMLTEGWLSRARYELAKKRIFAQYRHLPRM